MTHSTIWRLAAIAILLAAVGNVTFQYVTQPLLFDLPPDLVAAVVRTWVSACAIVVFAILMSGELRRLERQERERIRRQADRVKYTPPANPPPFSIRKP